MSPNNNPFDQILIEQRELLDEKSNDKENSILRLMESENSDLDLSIHENEM